MKKHRFRFSKESREAIEKFNAAPSAPAEESAVTDAPAAPEVPEVPVAPETPATEAPAPAEAPAPEAPAGPFVVAWRTDVGCVRASNQDAVICADRLVGVADGMGGHQGGEIASGMTRDKLIEHLDGLAPDPETLHIAIRSTNRAVYLRATYDASLSGMGTTLSVMWIGPECMYIGHVGDSRVYRLRGGELQQITDDHSLVAEMQRAGILSAEQAANHPMKNVITRAVGTEAAVEIDMLAVARKPGDVWLICSDGLHGMVSDEEIRATLAANAPEQAADLLIKAALDAGGKDNVSLVIVLDVEGAE